jgi:hypothetical protein
MGVVKTSFKYVLTQIIAAVLVVAIIAVPGLLLVSGEVSETAVQEIETLITSADPAALGGAAIAGLLVFLVVNLFVTGVVAQTLWGWDSDHSYLHTGLKFVFIGFIASLLRFAANILFEGIVVTQYDSVDAFIQALEAGTTEAYMVTGAAVLLVIVGFLAVGFVARLFGWD